MSNITLQFAQKQVPHVSGTAFELDLKVANNNSFGIGNHIMHGLLR